VTLAEAIGLPANALNSVRLLAEPFRDTKVKIEDVIAEISRTSETDAVARRLKI